MRRIAVVAAALLWVMAAIAVPSPANAQVFWVGSNTTQWLPMEFSLTDGTRGSVDRLYFVAELLCPKTRGRLTVGVALEGFDVPVAPDGAFLIEHLDAQFYVRVAGAVNPQAAYGWGAADVNWAGLFPESRGPMAARKLNTQKCFAEQLRWEAFMVMASPGGDPAQSAVDYLVRFAKGSDGVQVTVSPTP